jgi:HEAT repeat protein
MGVRVGLLAELERRKLVDGPPRWLRLLSAEAPTPDRVTAIRAAGAFASEPVRARLIGLLSDPDARVAAAAASALGSPGNAAVVKPLTTALSHESSTVRMAAIRGLGRVATPEAMRALESAAASHPDPETRRRARAELQKRGTKTAVD